MKGMRLFRAAAHNQAKMPLLLGVIGALWWSAAAAQSELVIYKDGTNLYHRAGCDLIRDMKGVVAMTRAQAEARNYQPHADCDPGVAKPGAPVGSPAAQAEPLKPKPQIVYVDGGKYYHRKDCRRLDPTPKVGRAQSVDEAGKSLWPCPDCRPPKRPRTGTSPPLGRVR
jgi:hypothetical protein